MKRLKCDNNRLEYKCPHKYDLLVRKWVYMGGGSIVTISFTDKELEELERICTDCDSFKVIETR